MWSSDRSLIALGLAGLLAVAGCTAQPLDGQLSSALSSTVNETLRQTAVDPVETRVAQQVRNELLFAMHGGAGPATPRQAVRLTIRPLTQALAVPRNGRISPAAQVQIDGSYVLRDLSDGSEIAKGRRLVSVPYDRTDQQFANQRAERDAQNRAARELARQLRLDIAQRLARR